MVAATVLQSEADTCPVASAVSSLADIAEKLAAGTPGWLGLPMAGDL